VTKSRIGFLIATIALVTITEKITVSEVVALEHQAPLICLVLGLAGLSSWGLGRWGEVKRAREQPAEGLTTEERDNQDPLCFLRSSKYWGIIMVLSAAMLTCAVSLHPPTILLQARESLTVTNIVTLTNFVTVTNQKPVVTFPPLDLAGVVVNRDQSSAVINGRVLRVGEMIGEVRLVGVDPSHAMMALGGETNVVELHRQRAR
jgi:hypothetical protein